ncbi:endolytic transglycosylase MltG [Salinispira pacifica]
MDELKSPVPETAARSQNPPRQQSQPLEEGAPKRRRGLTIFLTIFLTLLVAAGAAAGYAYYLNLPAGTSAAGVPFTVKRGESLDAVAGRLAADRLIRSPLLFKVIGFLSGTSGDIQAGHYLLRPNMSSAAIYRALLSGKQILVRVTIPEGFTMRQIAHRLDAEGIVSADDFLAAATDPTLLASFDIPGESAEGYLFPDTYLFPRDYPADEVVRHLVQNFFSRLKSINPDFSSLSPKELFRKVTLASIVEREYVSPDEAPLIASVFVNRLNAGMRLESCATVVYVMTEQDGLPHPERLYYRDLDRPSPYNTYLHRGLPPGPISNPGTTALKAAFFPAKTDYWYFVLQSDGATHHHFSRTLTDHNRAAVFYLKTLSTGN